MAYYEVNDVKVKGYSDPPHSKNATCVHHRMVTIFRCLSMFPIPCLTNDIDVLAVWPVQPQHFIISKASNY